MDAQVRLEVVDQPEKRRTAEMVELLGPVVDQRQGADRRVVDEERQARIKTNIVEIPGKWPRLKRAVGDNILDDHDPILDDRLLAKRDLSSGFEPRQSHLPDDPPVVGFDDRDVGPGDVTDHRGRRGDTVQGRLFTQLFELDIPQCFGLASLELRFRKFILWHVAMIPLSEPTKYRPPVILLHCTR